MQSFVKGEFAPLAPLEEDIWHNTRQNCQEMYHKHYKSIMKPECSAGWITGSAGVGGWWTRLAQEPYALAL